MKLNSKVFFILQNFVFLSHLHIIHHSHDATKPEFWKSTFPTNHGLTKRSPPLLEDFTFRDDMAVWSHPPLVVDTSRFPTCSSLAFRIKFWMSILLIASLLYWEVKSRKASWELMKCFVFSKTRLPEVIFTGLCAYVSIYIWKILATSSIVTSIL